MQPAGQVAGNLDPDVNFEVKKQRRFSFSLLGFSYSRRIAFSKIGESHLCCDGPTGITSFTQMWGRGGNS